MADSCEIDQGAGPGAPADNTPPSAQELKAVEGLEVIDHDNVKHSFKSLYSGPHASRRVVIIFVRHFFCGSCSSYVKFLSEEASPEKLAAINTSIIFIGNGDPKLINMYVANTGCAHPVYVDPTGKLFDGLGMIRTWTEGQGQGYAAGSTAWFFYDAVTKFLWALLSGYPATKVGKPNQQGGEFLFEGEAEEKTVTWCHRMRYSKDHTPTDEILKVLWPEGSKADGPRV